ncbi:pre-mRNA splicing factor prp17, putative [Ricinus communis]|uniref:Pre-mRNA-processing factor 17 n=1 Tax=Ricinus communis TaxID=3988 RepID=B9SHB9_RICCO|nr:pre-mRNA splicing factor prp17, putative [Ricinus communis]
MDLLRTYRNDDESDEQEHQNPNSSPDSSPPRLLPSKSAAPKVDDTTLALAVAQANQILSKPIDPVQHAVAYNPTYDQLWAPIQGPAHPYAKDGIAQGMRNHKLGFVEDAAIDSFVFDEQYNTFHKYGYAADPSASEGNNYVGDLDALRNNNAISVYNIPQNEQKRQKVEKKIAAKADETEDQCMRTYMGHSKAVRDISFCNDGTKFLTAGYDKNIKYWDTETGQVISTFSTGKIPYVVKLDPDDDKQNILLAGMSDKKIVQWDMNTGQITQEYDQHLGAVNTITFVDNNRRFVTSSDDKSLRVWEFGIPVVIKYISEPHMHSMPSIAVHPNTNWFAAQSMDNQILIYSTRERFQLNKKKTFKGHTVAGYACQVNFSPDGRFVMSGDGEGKCWFWDWKSTKVFRTLKCHEGVCIGCEWHPLEQSKVATCGWDGLIKYW